MLFDTFVCSFDSLSWFNQGLFFLFFIILMIVLDGNRGICFSIKGTEDVVESKMFLDLVIKDSFSGGLFGLEFFIVPWIFGLLDMNLMHFFYPGFCFSMHILFLLSSSLPLSLGLFMSSVSQAPLSGLVGFCPGFSPIFVVPLINIMELVSLLMRGIVLSLRMSMNLLVGHVLLGSFNPLGMLEFFKSKIVVFGGFFSVNCIVFVFFIISLIFVLNSGVGLISFNKGVIGILLVFILVFFIPMFAIMSAEIFFCVFQVWIYYILLMNYSMEHIKG